MANERKEPTLSSSSLKDPRTRTGKQPTPNSERRAATAPNRPKADPRAQARPRPAAPRPEPVKSSNGLVWFVMLLSVIALCVAAYNMWQLQLANTTIVDQQVRIVELEQKLTLTGDTSSQSITSLAANFSTLSDDVKLSLTEIDKLWATRNVNKEAITENDTQLDSLGQTTKTLQSDLSSAAQKLSAIESANKTLSESLQAQVKSVSDQLAALTQQSETQTRQLASFENQFKTLADDNAQLERLTQTLKTQSSQQEITLQSLRERVSSNTQPNSQQLDQLAAQVRDNQEAISAIDAFRITVNRELLLLKQGTTGAQ